MKVKKPTKIIRTDKWTLNPTAQQRVLFGETVKVYRRLCRYVVGIVFTHWSELGGLSSQQQIPAVERLIHATAKRCANGFMAGSRQKFAIILPLFRAVVIGNNQ
nr:hypothetical protein [Spirulina subsalsa]